MPDAATHDRIAAIAAPVIAVPTYSTLTTLGDAPDVALGETAILVAAHLFGSWWLSPDLDLDSKIDDRWGPLRVLWLPYMKAVPHRHWFSHSGISGVFRLIYLYAIVSLVLFIVSALLLQTQFTTVNYFQVVSNWLWETGRNHTRIALLIVAGIVISDGVHVASDLIDSWRKRNPRRRRRRKR
jgi:uncharacterized metal-binding protein